MKSTREVDSRIRIGRPVAKELGSHPEGGQKLALLLLAKIFFPELIALRLEVGILSNATTLRSQSSL